jgi:formate hydrogenlyase subunit 3/multisubunit Na+/H+ antiporter MnhD subunit
MPVLTRTQSQADNPAPLAKEARKGATLMEYLMMISLIIVVCLVGIGYLGGSNNLNMSSSAKKITTSLKKS